jgi:hypothetical protein
MAVPTRHGSLLVRDRRAAGRYYSVAARCSGSSYGSRLSSAPFRWYSCSHPSRQEQQSPPPPPSGERPFAVLAFTVIGDRAVAIDVFNDPELVGRLDIRGISA